MLKQIGIKNMCEHFNVVKSKDIRSEEIDSFHFSRIIFLTTKIINALIFHFFVVKLYNVYSIVN